MTYASVDDFIKLYSLETTLTEDSQKRDVERLLRLASDYIDSLTRRKKSVSEGYCGDTSKPCSERNFPQYCCDTNLIASISTATLPSIDSVGNYWSIDADITIDSTLIKSGSYMLGKIQTNYPLLSDFEILTEEPTEYCPIPDMIIEATLVYAKYYWDQMQSDSTTADDCDRSLKIGSLSFGEIKKSDGVDDSLFGKSPFGIEFFRLICPYEVIGYKMS